MRFVFLVAALSLAVPSLAQTPGGGAAERFERLDENNDGRLSRKEAANDAFFDAADTNDNGFVTLQEAQRWINRQRRRSQPGAGESTAPVFPANPEVVAKKRAVLAQVPRASADSSRPNVVLILADDLGYGDTAVYGSEAIKTPYIDKLASQGVRFTNAYVTAASCSPSRAGLITGRYQQRYGFEFNTSGAAITHRLHRGLNPAAITIADVIKRAGYRTGVFGKWHLGTQPQFRPDVRGFDEFYGFLAGAHSFFPAQQAEPLHSSILRGDAPIREKEYLTDAIARETVAFIHRNANQPFFAYVPFNAVHTPIEATKEYQDRYPDVDEPTRRDYYAMTSALDDAVGAILASLDRHNLAEKTLVIFLNDNGGPIYTGVQSNGNLKLGKLFLFEGGIRVPMVIRWLGVVPNGETFSGLTSSLDVFPTICAATKVQIPDVVQLDGVDLLPYLNGSRSGSPHDVLFWSNGPNKAVRQQNWKYVRSGESRWLYDLSVDIGEQNNLAEQEVERRAQLEKRLESWLKTLAPPAWPSKPNRRKVDVDGGVYELNI